MTAAEVKEVIEQFEVDTKVDFMLNFLNSPFASAGEAWTALEKRIADASESRFGCIESGHRHHTKEEAEACTEATYRRQRRCYNKTHSHATAQDAEDCMAAAVANQ